MGTVTITLGCRIRPVLTEPEQEHKTMEDLQDKKGGTTWVSSARSSIEQSADLTFVEAGKHTLDFVC